MYTRSGETYPARTHSQCLKALMASNTAMTRYGVSRGYEQVKTPTCLAQSNRNKGNDNDGTSMDKVTARRIPLYICSTLRQRHA